MAKSSSTNKTRVAMQRKVTRLRTEMQECIADTRSLAGRVKRHAEMTSREAAELDQRMADCAMKYEEAQSVLSGLVMVEVRRTR